MPITFAAIKDAWSDLSPTSTEDFAWEKCNDRHSTMIYIEFTFRSNPAHVSLNCGKGGDCTSFHVTEEKSEFITHPTIGGKKSKAGGTKSIKSCPSVYYDFAIGGTTETPKVTFSLATQQYTSGMEKAVTVVNGVGNASLLHGVTATMRELISQMVRDGRGSID